MHENVQFTVYRPQAVQPERWVPLLAFAHLSERLADAPRESLDPLEEVERQARGILGDQIRAFTQIRQDSTRAVPDEAEVTFAPEIPGFRVEPPARTFRWIDAVHREEFRLRAGADLDGQVARGRLSVFLGRILLAEVSLAIRVDSAASDAAVQPTAMAPVLPFRRIFASYSHRDEAVVAELERFAGSLGDRYLRDVRDLRAGEVWSRRLEELIAEADVFQLFWSWNALRSPFVEQEWRYALALGRANFIRPTYWEEPLPEDPANELPPADLRRVQFHLLRGGTGSLSSVPSPLSVPTEKALAPPSKRPARSGVGLYLGTALVLVIGIGWIAGLQGVLSESEDSPVSTSPPISPPLKRLSPPPTSLPADPAETISRKRPQRPLPPLPAQGACQLPPRIPQIPPQMPPGMPPQMPAVDLPSQPRLAVLAAGDPILVVYLEQEMERRLARRFDVADEHGEPAVDDLLQQKGSKVSQKELGTQLMQNGFHVLILMRVEESERRGLEIHGLTGSMKVARIRLNAYMLPTGRPLGRGWTEMLEYTELSAQGIARNAFIGPTADLIRDIEDGWSQLRAAADAR